MVAQDSATAWDLKPNRENTNQIFNVLCNVQPVEHPWSGDWYARQLDVTTWSKQQYRFEKCKGLKKCTLYKYAKDWDNATLVESEDTYTDDWRENSNFTDVILFQWYRIYMRKNNRILNPYWEYVKTKEIDWVNVKYMEKWWDWDEDTCDVSSRPSDRLRWWTIDPTITNKKWHNNWQQIEDYESSGLMRIYIQPTNIQGCTWDTFDDPDEAPIILVKEYQAAECNPDHFIMWYGGIWIPDAIKAKKWMTMKIAMIYFGGQHYAYLYDQRDVISTLDYISLWELWIYVSWLTAPDANGINMLDILWLPLDWYFIPNVSELMQIIPVPELAEGQDYAYKDTDIWKILRWYKEYWEVPYFAAGNKIYSINWLYSIEWDSINILSDEDLPYFIYKWETINRTPCEALDVNEYKRKRLFIFDNVLSNATNEDVITWLEKWWTRICYIANNHLYVSWSWMLNWLFTSIAWDNARWVFNIPAWLTDVRAMYWSLLLFWPKAIYAITNQDALVAGNFINATENEDGYYSPWSFYNDDGEFLIVRRWKLLETLQFSAYYWTVQFTPDTWFYVNWHIKPLNNKYDMINVDATINHRYISIYDDNMFWPHYSKLLIYDKHYNCRYHWLITWARIVHVKDWIFLWDWVYTNKWRTRWWKDNDTEWWEIIEIISAYVWEEWLQTPKHIQYIKTAIWGHSVITKDSLWDINTSLGWKLFERRKDITVTRYPQLLFSKNSTDPIKSYENGEQIYWHWELHSHTLLNEIAEYRHYDKFSETIIREMWESLDSTSKLAMFASIKEPVNAPANLLELCISARHFDNVQFGSFYVWYYTLDPDYEDIENTNIDTSWLTDETSEPTININSWEYCEEILAGSACDSPE